jgi:DNA-directed RNA polymerase alpha subunit
MRVEALTVTFDSQAEMDDFMAWHASRRRKAFLAEKNAGYAASEVKNAWMSVRTCNALHEGGVRTLAQAAAMTDAELLGLPGFGKKCLRELREYIENGGPHWRAMATSNDA